MSKSHIDITQLSEAKQRLIRNKLVQLKWEKQKFNMLSMRDRAKLPEDVLDAFPCTQAQVGMIYEMEKTGKVKGVADYHNVNGFGFSLEQPFNANLFKLSLMKVTENTPYLRTTFEPHNFDEPIQLVHKQSKINVEVCDIQGFDETRQVQKIQAQLNHELSHAFNLQTLPLVRFYIHILSPKRIHIIFAEPHVLADGWSTHLTLKDIMETYLSLVDGQIFSLPIFESLYQDFVKAEREQLVCVKAQEFWQEKIRNTVNSDVPRPVFTPKSKDVVREETPIGLTITEGFETISKNHNLGIKYLYLGAFVQAYADLLHANKITVGVHQNGRLEESGGTQTRGLFLNALPMTVSLNGHRTALDLIKHIQLLDLQALPYRRFPLAEMINMNAGKPLFNCHFGLINFHSLKDNAYFNSGKIKRLESEDYAHTNFHFNAIVRRDFGDKHDTRLIVHTHPEFIDDGLSAYFGERYLYYCAELIRDINQSPVQTNPANEKQRAFWKQQLAYFKPKRYLQPMSAKETIAGELKELHAHHMSMCIELPPHDASLIKQLETRLNMGFETVIYGVTALFLARWSSVDKLLMTRLRGEISGEYNVFPVAVDLAPTLFHDRAEGDVCIRDVFVQIDKGLQNEQCLSLTTGFLSHPEIGKHFKQCLVFVDEHNKEASDVWKCLQSQVGLGLRVHKSDKIVTLNFICQTQTTSFKQVHSVVRGWRDLLTNVCLYLDHKISASQLPLVSPEQKKAILTLPLQENGTIAESHFLKEFAAAVLKYPQHIAAQEGDLILTYAELNAFANQVANGLISIFGVMPSERILLSQEASIPALIGLLGIMKSNAVYVPIQEDIPSIRLSHIVASTKARLLLGTLNNSLNVSELGLNVLSLKLEMWSHHSAECPHSNPNCINHDRLTNLQTTKIGNLAYILHTSGSTGIPKGVQVSHQNLMNYIAHVDANYWSERTVGAVVSTSLTFDATVTSMLAPLLAGKKVIFLNSDDQYTALHKMMFEAQEVLLFKLTPSQLKAIAVCGEHADVNVLEHTLVLGGEKLSKDLIVQWRNKYLPNARYINEYGPTEATVGTVWYQVNDNFNESASVPIGRAINNTKLYVLDSRQHLCPQGVAGELYIAGPSVAIGYEGLEEQTAACFIANPYSDKENSSYSKLYKTGDRVVCHFDGELEYLGRDDDQIKLRGFRIELAEIESALLQQAEVDVCLVKVVNETLLGFVHARSGHKYTQEQLTHIRFQLTKILPKYMVPARLVGVEVWKLTHNGKIDEGHLIVCAKSQPDHHNQALTCETEKKLAQLWGDLFQIEVHALVKETNFISLGGHSLLIMKLRTMLQKKFNISLELRELLDHLDLGELAILIDFKRKANAAQLSSDESELLEEIDW